MSGSGQVSEWFLGRSDDLTHFEPNVDAHLTGGRAMDVDRRLPA